MDNLQVVVVKAIEDLERVAISLEKKEEYGEASWLHKIRCELQKELKGELKATA